MARTGKTGPTRFGIQARVLALAILFTLLAAGIIVATSARSLRDQLRRSVIQSAEYAVQAAADGIRQDILEIDALPTWCALNYTARTALFSDFSPGTLAHTAYPFISNRYGAMRTASYIQRFLIVTSSGRTIMLGTATSQSRAVNGANAALFPGMGEGEEPVQWDRLADDPLMQSGAPMTGIPVARSISNGSGGTARIYLSVSPALITGALKGFGGEDGSWLCWIMGDQLYRVEGDALVCLGGADQLPEPELEAGDALDEGHPALLRRAGRAGMQRGGLPPGRPPALPGPGHPHPGHWATPVPAGRARPGQPDPGAGDGPGDGGPPPPDGGRPHRGFAKADGGGGPGPVRPQPLH